MNAADCDTRIESALDRSPFVPEPVNLQAVVRQVRICRSTLGAILDVLETAELKPESLERAAESSMNVTAEIEQFWNSCKELINTGEQLRSS